MEESARNDPNAAYPSTEPYKGVRDFYPHEQFVQSYIIDLMGRTAETFGYEEYSASILESTQLYARKTSEEIIQHETYTFTDRGKRSVTLRPEMTPSVARMVAAKRRELSYPLRWYSIPNVFRYERPQRGRLREHWQLNCDIFGAPGIEADVEIIALAHAIMREFGAQERDFEIRINSRTALNAQFASLGLSHEQADAFRRLLDRKSKMSEEDFSAQARAIAEHIPLPFAYEQSEDVTQVLTQLSELGIGNAQWDAGIVRGFDYYTGVVFEVFDTNPQNRRSLFGGGRYDNLLDIFGAEPLPAVGFGMGDVTLRDFLEAHDLLPAYRPPTDLYLCTTTPALITRAHQLADRLRREDIAVAVNLLDKKLGEQIKTAERKKIPYILTLGDDELASGVYKLKHLASGKERSLREDEIAQAIFESET